MMALLAQAASSGEWHDGWQLAVVTFTALTIVAGWIHRQSKSDLKSIRDELGDLRTELKAEVASAEAKLTNDITDLKTDLASARTELKTDIATARTELKTEVVSAEERLKADITELKADLTSAENSLKADIAEVGGDLKNLQDKLYDDARSQAAMYQWQLAATQPATSEAPLQQSPPQPKQLAETRTD